MSDTQQVRPFSNGSQYADWTGCNGDRCTKGAHLLEADALPTCEIELALGEAYLGDGTVDADIAQRMGYTTHNDRYVWPCSEVVWTAVNNWRRDEWAQHGTDTPPNWNAAR